MIQRRNVRLTVILLTSLLLVLLGLRNYWVTNGNTENLDFKSADNVTGFSYPIVPNIVHFFKFRNHNFTFNDMVCLLAAWCHQRPDSLLIHCDCETLDGPYWKRVRDLKGVRVVYMKEPRAVFGRPLSSVYHSGDVARIFVLSQYGGIALDLDSYVVQSLDRFRHFEFTVGWMLGENLGCQVMLAHKNARFLRLWIDSYQFYRPEQWYYNAGVLPTKLLLKQPSLVHRVSTLFGVNLNTDWLYKKMLKEWRMFYAIHLLIRHRRYLDSESNIKEFDEDNIKIYPFTYGEMARLVVYGQTGVNVSSKWNFEQCRS